MSNSNHKEKNPMDRLAKSIGHHLPKGHAFALLVYQFPTDGKGAVYYIGDGPRPDTIGVMKQFVQKHEPGTAFINPIQTAWLIQHIKDQQCSCCTEKKTVCDRCQAIAILEAIPKSEITLHDSMDQCMKLARWLSAMECGWPRVDEKHPEGMDIFEAITGYVEELRKNQAPK